MEPLSANAAATLPVTTHSHNPLFEIEEGYEDIVKACLFLPIPILAGVSIGGAGFGLWTAFGTTASTTSGSLPAAAIANIAFDAFAAIGGCFAGGCYWHNLPRYTFEQDIAREAETNEKAEKIELNTEKEVTDYRAENEKLKTTLSETVEKMGGLEAAIEQKRIDLLKLKKELKETVNELKTTKKDFMEAKVTVKSAKKLVIQLMKSSEGIKNNIKASNVALSIFKGCNDSFYQGISDLKVENDHLATLLTQYSKIVEEEHSNFMELIQTCDQLDKTCTDLKNEIKELSLIDANLGKNNEKEKESDRKLELLDQQIESLNHNLENQIKGKEKEKT